LTGSVQMDLKSEALLGLFIRHTCVAYFMCMCEAWWSKLWANCAGANCGQTVPS